MIEAQELYHVPRSQIWEGSRGRQQGRVHLHVRFDFSRGRFKRAGGECLCSKKRGSMEREPMHGELRCEVCAARGERYGIAWPSQVREAK